MMCHFRWRQDSGPSLLAKGGQASPDSGMQALAGGSEVRRLQPSAEAPPEAEYSPEMTHFDVA